MTFMKKEEGSVDHGWSSTKSEYTITEKGKGKLYLSKIKKDW